MDKMRQTADAAIGDDGQDRYDEVGIARGYVNAAGLIEPIDETARRRIYDAMASGLESPNSPLPPVCVFSAGKSYIVTILIPNLYQWKLRPDDYALAPADGGGFYEGQIAPSDEQITLPADLVCGYYRLTLRAGDALWHTSVIISPGRCFARPVDERLWGMCVQLYTLRSANDWGIGDFGALKEALYETARRGGAFVGVNPLHALYPAVPENASPYSPSSRTALNVAYIDVEAVAEFQASESAIAWWKSADVQNERQRLRQTDSVDYAAVMTLKMTALRLAWQSFDDPQRKQAFRRFLAERGEAIIRQAEFDALHYALTQGQENAWGWPVWPEAYRRHDSETVRRFAESHDDDVRFYAWLQWLAHQQLSECFTLSRRLGMAVGLYGDLAVGVAEGGVQTWCDKTLYRMKASVGAPPDPLGPQGQNWGLPPMDPHVLRQRAYRPFIEVLRANMRYFGALRIDHVMSLLRLWWVPYGETADAGGYVAYPLDDLLAILTLESQRHRCVVIGEDLGIVPPEIVQKLRDAGVYSYKVLYFEKEGAGFRPPERYLPQSMATPTTHDLPTLVGYWQKGDLRLGESLGIYPDAEVLAALDKARDDDKRALEAMLLEYGFLAKPLSPGAMTDELNVALHRFIASTSSQFVGLQPEDWLLVETPVNVPGTSDQYPNWRRRLPATLASAFESPLGQRLLEAVQRGREGHTLDDPE